MHEMSIAESILDIARETLAKKSPDKIISIKIQVGELAAVVPDSLQFCFDAITETTEFKNTKLIIEEVPLSGKCRDCQLVFPIKNYMFKCNNCSSTDIEVVGGQELSVSELEVE